MNIRQYLDSTYLKTASQAGLTDEENRKVAAGIVAEAIGEGFKLVMIRPEIVAMAKEMVKTADSSVLVGTVIGFPDGTASVEDKLKEATKAIEDGADELDFVCNYPIFKNGESDDFKEEILKCTELCVSHRKTIKWIIEVAALNIEEIARICALIKHLVMSEFECDLNHIFVKSSTGFYETEPGIPNGATREAIIVMLENAAPLPVKAAGGVRNYEEAVELINLGVKRIGTSSAKAIARQEDSASTY